MTLDRAQPDTLGPAYVPDGDALYDAHISRVDAGEECPTCRGRRISAAIALDIPLFHCDTCGAEWIDAYTQPSAP